jgi:predicted HTH transcriptional regulator
MPTQSLDSIIQSAESGKFTELIGLHEDEHFEAKGKTPYDLDTAAGRYELAKDVSSFANADGGLIVIGLEHEKETDRAVDIVRGLQLIAQADFNAAQYEGIVRNNVYPTIQGIEIRWIADENGSGLGVGVIRVPQQSPESKPFIISQVVEGGAYLKQIVVGFALRSGSDSNPLTPKQMQQNLKKGMDPLSQRLSRIEDKIDSLLEQQIQITAPIDDAQLDERIKRIIES